MRPRDVLPARILRHYGTSAGPYRGGYRLTRADIPAQHDVV
jgi:hypothetical protein